MYVICIKDTKLRSAVEYTGSLVVSLSSKKKLDSDKLCSLSPRSDLDTGAKKSRSHREIARSFVK